MGEYDDIIDRPHHVSRRHPRMAMLNRAAQFSPFAALTGFGAEIIEAARETERWIELSEEEKAVISERLGQLAKRLPAEASVTWFIHDARKEGGRYVTRDVRIKQILPAEGRIVLAGGESIDMDELLDIELPGPEGGQAIERRDL